MPYHPIRWDNVNSRSPAEASQPMMAAAQLFNGAFSDLAGTIKQGEAIDSNNAMVTRNNNTNAYLNGLFSKYTNADDLSAAIKAGTVSQDLAQYGNNIDSSAVRGAADARLTQLMTQKQNEINYNHAMTDEKVAPIVDAAHAAALRGDTAEFNRLAGQYTAANGRDLAGVLSYKDARDQQMKERGYLDTNQQLNVDKGRQEIAASKATVDYQKGVLGNMQAQTKLAQGQFAMNLQDRFLQERGRLMDRMGALFARDPRTAEGMAAVNAQIDNMTKDEDTRAMYRRSVAESLQQNPNATVGDITSSLMGADLTRWYKNEAWQRSNVVSAVRDATGSSASLAQRANTNTQLGMVANDLATTQKQFTQMMADYMPGGRFMVPGGASGGGGGSGGAPGMIPNPSGLPAPAPLSPTAGDAEVAAAAAAIKASQTPGTYGPNGFVPNSAPGATAQPSWVGKGFNEMTPAERNAKWEATHAGDSAKAAAAAAAAIKQAQDQAASQKAAQVDYLQRNIAALESAQAAGRLLDPSRINDLRTQLAALTR